MSVINKEVTEEQLKDMYQAIVAVQREKGKAPDQVILTAQDLTYAVFRGLFTYDSVIESIVNNAGKVFSH